MSDFETISSISCAHISGSGSFWLNPDLFSGNRALENNAVRNTNFNNSTGSDSEKRTGIVILRKVAEYR
jgi:hypothetical protein